MTRELEPGWETLIQDTRPKVYSFPILPFAKLLRRNFVQAIISLVLASWIVRELCRATYFALEHRALIAMNSNPQAHSGPLTLDQVAAQNPSAITVQLLKSEDEHLYHWKVAKGTMDLLAFHAIASLDAKGEIVHLMRLQSGFRENFDVSVMFYSEMGQYLPSFRTPNSQMLGERISQGYSGVRKTLVGENEPYVHKDLSKPLVLLQLQLEEDVGKANASAFVVVVGTIEAFDKLNQVPSD